MSIRSKIDAKSRFNRVRTVALTALGLSAGFAAVPVQAEPPALHVSGNRLVDDSDNARFLKGVNITGLENDNNPTLLRAYTDEALGSNWQAKILRLPISQDRWEGYAGADKATYRQYVYDIVQKASDANAYVLLEIHWSDMGVWGANLSQHNMPDDNTATTWADLASDPKLANNPAVFFGVYNEPHDAGSGLDGWNVWLSNPNQPIANNGYVTEQFNGQTYTYHTPGIQGLINTIRAQKDANGYGTSNVLFVGGLDYAYDLREVANGDYVPSEPGGRGIVYDVHIYPFQNVPAKPSTASPDVWDQYVTVEAGNAPIFLGEYGTSSLGETQDGKTFIEGLQNWAVSHAFGGGFCGTTAWAFDNLQGDGNLLSDRTTFAPTQYEGYTVQYFLTH